MLRFCFLKFFDFCCFIKSQQNIVFIHQKLDLFYCLLFRIIDFLRHGKNEEQLKRASWPPFEPRNIGIGCFAIAYVFVFLQILSLMRISRIFGPLQLSLTKMLINVVQFLCIFCLVLFAFGLALTELYSHHGSLDDSQKLCTYLKNGTLGRCNYTKFQNMGNSLQSLFWSLFGHVDIEALSLKGKQPFVEGIGFVLIGIYHVAAIIILINMLIAMMAKSFEATSSNKDAEWKFYRTVVWIQFIRNETTHPPPMNLISDIWKVGSLVRRCFLKPKIKSSTECDGKCSSLSKSNSFSLNTNAHEGSSNKLHHGRTISSMQKFSGVENKLFEYDVKQILSVQEKNSNWNRNLTAQNENVDSKTKKMPEPEKDLSTVISVDQRTTQHNHMKYHATPADSVTKRFAGCTLRKRNNANKQSDLLYQETRTKKIISNKMETTLVNRYIRSELLKDSFKKQFS